jgi:predicted O-methyltransferase YrrM
MDSALIRDEYDLRCVDGSDIHAHLPRLYAEASRPNVRVIELGVRSGNSTAAFLLAAEDQAGEVWSVDIAAPRCPFYGHPRWHLIVGDDLDDETLDGLPSEVDVLFIDTSHTYDQTLAELRTYWRRVTSGGVILMHDTELEQPEASPPSDPPFPVRAAVEQWCSEVGLSAMYVSGCYGLGIVRVP